jgi:hypothetical protein
VGISTGGESSPGFGSSGGIGWGSIAIEMLLHGRDEARPFDSNVAPDQHGYG